MSPAKLQETRDRLCANSDRYKELLRFTGTPVPVPKSKTEREIDADRLANQVALHSRPVFRYYSSTLTRGTRKKAGV